MPLDCPPDRVRRLLRRQDRRRLLGRIGDLVEQRRDPVGVEIPFGLGLLRRGCRLLRLGRLLGLLGIGLLDFGLLCLGLLCLGLGLCRGLFRRLGLLYLRLGLLLRLLLSLQLLLGLLIGLVGSFRHGLRLLLLGLAGKRGIVLGILGAGFDPGNLRRRRQVDGNRDERHMLHLAGREGDERKEHDCRMQRGRDEGALAHHDDSSGTSP